METVWVEFMTDRTGSSPDNNWAKGECRRVPVERARDLVLGSKTAKLADGESWPIETASLDAGETPERATPVARRERGDA